MSNPNETAWEVQHAFGPEGQVYLSAESVIQLLDMYEGCDDIIANIRTAELEISTGILMDSSSYREDDTDG